MPQIEVIEENPVSLVELKENLVKIKKRDKELSTRSTKTEDFLQKLGKGSLKKQEALKKKLGDSGVSRLKTRHIGKLIDLKPKDLDSLRSIFSAENVTFKQEDLNKIIAILNDK